MKPVLCSQGCSQSGSNILSIFKFLTPALSIPTLYLRGLLQIKKLSYEERKEDIFPL
jgi:hypothetical protein